MSKSPSAKTVKPTLGAGPLVPELGIRPQLLRWLPDRPAHSFAAAKPAGPKAVAAWQSGARRAFRRCLGRFPDQVELRPILLEKQQMDGYTRTMFTYATAPNLRALAWLLLPDGASASRGKLPVVVATPGHGIGAKDLIALDAKGQARKEGDGYQKDYALQALRLGYATLVVEPLGFGERRDAAMAAGKTPESGCHAAVTLATMLGTSLAAIRANDLMRGMDYLETLPNIDSKRLVLMGISGGGQMTLWTAAIEPRVKGAVVSGYTNTVRASIMGMHHCICNFIPNMGMQLDIPDLGCLIAPRPLLIEGGTKDPIFPIAQTREAIAYIKKAYAAMGVADRLTTDLFEADHQWSGKKLPAFLRRVYM